MQYLLKITIEDTRVWRLIAVDGQADLAHMAGLMALAFDYEKGECSFEVFGKTLSAGSGGRALTLEETHPFDSLGLCDKEEFIFKSAVHPALLHRVLIMKKVEHLDCVMPSCLVGAGLLPDKAPLLAQDISDYYDSEDAKSLDLREVTQRLRAFGSVRASSSDNLTKVASIPFG